MCFQTKCPKYGFEIGDLTISDHYGHSNELGIVKEFLFSYDELEKNNLVYYDTKKFTDFYETLPKDRKDKLFQYSKNSFKCEYTDFLSIKPYMSVYFFEKNITSIYTTKDISNSLIIKR